jgi:ribulose-5-phosphate 4-epimerase/fuculose-1-phosphate aldolase
MTSNDLHDSLLWQQRVDLAAAFRIAAHWGWHESVGNHFSAAVSADGHQFLLNPRWQHFALIKASDLLLVNSEDPTVLDGPDAPDPSAWCIHGRIHASQPQARVILHLHTPYVTALCGLANPALLPIDQCTARFFNRLAIDLGYSGIADDRAEGDRLARALGTHRCMLMGNHGALVTGATIAEAFEEMYYLERACQTLVLAYSTGQPLNVLSNDLALKTASDWDDYQGMAFAHFRDLKKQLDQYNPGYEQ